MTIRDGIFFAKPHIYKDGADYVFCLHHLRCIAPTPREARAHWLAWFISATGVTVPGAHRVLNDAEKHGNVRYT